MLDVQLVQWRWLRYAPSSAQLMMKVLGRTSGAGWPGQSKTTVCTEIVWAAGRAGVAPADPAARPRPRALAASMQVSRAPRRTRFMMSPREGRFLIRQTTVRGGSCLACDRAWIAGPAPGRR